MNWARCAASGPKQLAIFTQAINSVLSVYSSTTENGLCSKTTSRNTEEFKQMMVKVEEIKLR